MRSGGDVTSAIDYFNNVIEANPLHIGALYNLGILYIREGRLEEDGDAEMVFNKIIQ